MAEIYLAGGCFWGLEKYMSLISGVLETEVGYANGNTTNPTYEDVCYKNTGHAEAVRVIYDENIVPLAFLLELYSEAIDPTTLNRQGGDTGAQYRTGIYYTSKQDLLIIEQFIKQLQSHYTETIMIEIKPLTNYYTAEKYHQKYLNKNPNGYCHIGYKLFEKAAEAIVNPLDYPKPEATAISKKLSKIQYDVTQHSATEPPYNNEYWNTFKDGIYVDITTGEPLFVSTDKFESNCGWPSFSKPIDPNVIKENTDTTHGMLRTEVRSRIGDAHLGHVFDDGPQQTGGLRYCINSASLRFIPKAEMENEGYGYLLKLLQ